MDYNLQSLQNIWNNKPKLLFMILISLSLYPVITTEAEVETIVAHQVHTTRIDGVRVMRDPEHAPIRHVSQIVMRITIRCTIQAVYIDMGRHGCKGEIRIFFYHFGCIIL